LDRRRCALASRDPRNTGKAPTLGENNLPHESWQAMWTITGQLGQKRQRASNSGDACAAVYDDINPNILDKRAKETDRSFGGSGAEAGRGADQDREEFIGHLNTPDTRMRPYLAIAAATGLAYSHDYTAC
jgi:hypothetical protein